MGEPFRQAYDQSLDQNEKYSNRYFVFRGMHSWPQQAQIGNTVSLQLYEYLADQFVEIEVKIDYVEQISYESVMLQGYTVLDGVKYRATINLFRRHIYNANVILMPHS